jgi:hypothetical protein
MFSSNSFSKLRLTWFRPKVLPESLYQFMRSATSLLIAGSVAALVTTEALP